MNKQILMWSLYIVTGVLAFVMSFSIVGVIILGKSGNNIPMTEEEAHRIIWQQGERHRQQMFDWEYKRRMGINQPPRD